MLIVRCLNKGLQLNINLKLLFSLFSTSSGFQNDAEIMLKQLISAFFHLWPEKSNSFSSLIVFASAGHLETNVCCLHHVERNAAWFFISTTIEDHVSPFLPSLQWPGLEPYISWHQLTFQRCYVLIASFMCCVPASCSVISWCLVGTFYYFY